MSSSSHLEELQRRHEELDQRIADEERRPGSNDLEIQELKRQKLRLKEEVEKLVADSSQDD